MNDTIWLVYILQCGDGSLYTGITNNLPKRLDAHQSGDGAKYTQGKGPFKIIYLEHHKNRSEASKREIQIKKLKRVEKLQLIQEKINKHQ